MRQHSSRIRRALQKRRLTQLTSPYFRRCAQTRHGMVSLRPEGGDFRAGDEKQLGAALCRTRRFAAMIEQDLGGARAAVDIGGAV